MTNSEMDRAVFQEALNRAGDELEAAGCPCRCVCHRAGTFTFVPCKYCKHGNDTWPMPKANELEAGGRKDGGS